MPAPHRTFIVTAIFASVAALWPSPVPGAAAATARTAAQRGLDHLSRATPAWQRQHNCFGCHVQAVTMQAIAVGEDRGYELSEAFVADVLAGLTTVAGGARTEHGLSHQGGREAAESGAYGGSALAAFDQHVSDRARSDLLAAAEALLDHQGKDGSVHPEVKRFPVSPSAIHTTYRAVQTWRQTFARTADEAWLTPLRRGERWLAARAEQLLASPTKAGLQDLNYASLGLIEAGASVTEPVLIGLRAELVKRQSGDGGWAFSARGNASVPYATGQTLYALRRLGLGDQDHAVRRGTQWLVARQQQDGSWSAGGGGKAEAMWAVLGLVGIDIASIAVRGLEDGQRIKGTMNLHAQATANENDGIGHVELWIDDVLTTQAAGNQIRHKLKTAGLTDGMHLVDFVAVTTAGERARRRFVVYSGDHYLTDVGSRFEDGGTTIAFRDLADGASGKVRLRILSGESTIFEKVTDSHNGPQSLFWAGTGRSGGESTGRFRAELAWLDATGRARQTVQHEFVHTTQKKQEAAFGQVQGRIASATRGDLANTWIELVDDTGRVVEKVRSTRNGQYRFKNLDEGRYRVRVQKKGYDSWQQDVEVERGREVAADANL